MQLADSALVNEEFRPDFSWGGEGVGANGLPKKRRTVGKVQGEPLQFHCPPRRANYLHLRLPRSPFDSVIRKSA